MKRRTFIQQISLGAAAMGFGGRLIGADPSHLITLSFDDGFRNC